MNYYENKMLQEREGRMIGAGIGLIFCSIWLAFVFGALFAWLLSLPFLATFYVLWIVFAGFGVLSIYTAFHERAMRKRKNITD